MTILHTNCGVEKEPLQKAFGFKGSALTCLWQVAVRLKTEQTEAVGLGVQSVLWSDAQVFSRYGEETGNEMMLRTTKFALGQLRNVPLRNPREMMDRLFPTVYAYAAELTGMPDLRKTFARNALVPVDLALWQLWLKETGADHFDAIWDIPHEKQNRLANIPLITYGTTEEEILALAKANTPLLKIKIGSDPHGDGSVDAMVSWDCGRLLQIHRLVENIPTDHTGSGHILYYLDANGRYDSKENLLRLLDFAGEQGILERVILLEEPFPEESEIYVGDLPVTVAADESAHGLEEVRQRHSLGYKALALKPIAKGLTPSLEMARFALENGMACFCADLTVNPLMVSWNQCVASRLPKLPGMLVGVVESNGAQNYSNWQKMLNYHPAFGQPWLTPEGGVYELGEAFFHDSGGILELASYYLTLAERGNQNEK